MKLHTVKICICGSVDDGKSTLIGRILYETGNIFNDKIICHIIDNKYGKSKKLQ
jgi:bifunctional enzyme CysN/CysC